MNTNEPAKKIGPDGQAVAIRTMFEDDSPGAVLAYLSVDHRGISTYMTEAQVADWRTVDEIEGAR